MASYCFCAIFSSFFPSQWANITLKGLTIACIGMKLAMNDFFIFFTLTPGAIGSMSKGQKRDLKKNCVCPKRHLEVTFAYTDAYTLYVNRDQEMI